MMIGMADIIDITRTIGQDTVVFPGDTTPSVSQAHCDDYTISELALGSHSGTHIDAPLHFFDGRKSLDMIPVKRFFLDADVIAIKSQVAVTVEELSGCKIDPGQAILLKTRNSDLPRDRFYEDFVHIKPDAAELLVNKGVSMVGIDYLSPDRYGDTDFPVHRTLLGAGVLILEDIDLRAVAPGRYRLACLPIKTRHADGAPCRAVLGRRS
ncbi:MAG: cyclase family protein [Methanosarcinales archaeon]|nr:MAG: cyclase family protein [Methanosarcinales archaeon]